MHLHGDQTNTQQLPRQVPQQGTLTPITTLCCGLAFADPRTKEEALSCCSSLLNQVKITKIFQMPLETGCRSRGSYSNDTAESWKRKKASAIALGMTPFKTNARLIFENQGGYVSGRGGCGKSHLIEKLKDLFEAAGYRCDTTGFTHVQAAKLEEMRSCMIYTETSDVNDVC